MPIDTLNFTFKANSSSFFSKSQTSLSSSASHYTTSSSSQSSTSSHSTSYISTPHANSKNNSEPDADNKKSKFLGALKEWAIICKALEDGQQILLFRKGGIMEFRNGFELKYKNFFLFPTFEHQTKESVRREYRGKLEEIEKAAFAGENISTDTPSNNPNNANSMITSFVEISDFKQVETIDQLKNLDKFHIWTDEYLNTRFNYNPKKPLFLLLLRTYKLNKPMNITHKPQWVGCKSWIQLDPTDNEVSTYFYDQSLTDISMDGLKSSSVSKPCIDDNNFNKLSEEVRSVFL